MERFEELVQAEIERTLGAAPEKRGKAAELAKRIFQWLSEGGVDRIQEGLKQEVDLIEKEFTGQEERIAEHLAKG